MELKPSKGLPRILIVEWSGKMFHVSARTRKYGALAHGCDIAAELILMAHRYPYGDQPMLYSLHVGNVSFALSRRDFETLRPKLEPLGVRIDAEE